MSPQMRLVYAFLSLPSITRRSIAMRLGLFNRNDDYISRKDAARAVFQRATRAGLLSKLRAETSREGGDFPPVD